MKKPALALVSLALISIGLWYFGPQAYGQAGYLAIDLIEPKQLQIDSFFHGRDIAIRAIFPCDCELVLKIIGPREDLKLMKKGRVGGLWMNVEHVTFKNIPKVYLLWTPRNLPARGGSQSLKELKLDYASILSGSLPGKTGEQEESLIQELIKLKERDKLYNIFEGAIQAKPLEKSSMSQAEATLHLPVKIHPGDYTLELIAVKEGKNSLLLSQPLRVQLSGLPAIVLSLAAQRSLLYGILAVLIATLSGLGMGVLFSSKGGH
jgi:uncharacterized protein (TIGR02186 family)